MMIKSLGKYHGHKASIYKLVQYDEDHFLSVGGDGYVVKWKINGNDFNGHAIASVDAKAFSMCMLNDGIIVLGDMNGHIYFVDTWKNVTLKNVRHHRKGVFSLMVQNGYLFSGGGSGMISKWDIEKMMPVESIQLSSESIREIISVNQAHILVGSSDNNIYEVNTHEMTSSIKFESAHENSVFCLLKDENNLFTGGRDAHINKYDLLSEKLEARVPAHWFAVNDLVNIGGSNFMVSASRDKRIRLWNKEEMKVAQSVDVQNGGHINSVNSLLYLPTHKVLLSASDDRSISRFSVETH